MRKPIVSLVALVSAVFSVLGQEQPMVSTSCPSGGVAKCFAERRGRRGRTVSSSEMLSREFARVLPGYTFKRSKMKGCRVDRASPDGFWTCRAEDSKTNAVAWTDFYKRHPANFCETIDWFASNDGTNVLGGCRKRMSFLRLAACVIEESCPDVSGAKEYCAKLRLQADELTKTLRKSATVGSARQTLEIRQVRKSNNGKGTETIDEVLAKKGEMPKSGQPPKIFTEGYIPSSNAVQSVKEAVSNPQGEESEANGQATAVPHRGSALDYRTETVDGVAWHYYISNGVAVVEHPITRGLLRGPAVAKEVSGSVTVPNKLGGFPVGVIGRQALSWLKVTKVIVPPSVASIGEEAFVGCKSLGEVFLPCCVSSIGDEAFSYCTNLVSVTVPAGLTHIGRGAFQGCRRLAGFTIPTNCVSIGARAFEGCDALGKMKIPAGVRRIGDGAFPGLQSFVVDEQNQTFRHVDGGSYDKTGTRMLGFPSTGIVARISAAVTNISESACKDLGSAKSIEVDPENRFYKSVGGCLYDKNGTVLLRCARSMSQLAIPNGVKRIGPHAFEANAELVEVSFPTSVVEIGECAFYACRGLTSVSLPANVTNISGCAFSYCTSLESVTIPSSVKHVGNHAFNRCKNLKSVVLKPGVESVGNQAFISCPKLSVVHLPSSVRRFGRMGAYRTFDVWGHYTRGPNAPRRSKEDGALTFVVEKGDEERVRNLLYDRMYELQCRAARDRGLLYPEIKVVTEEEWQGGKSPVKADKKK